MFKLDSRIWWKVPCSWKTFEESFALRDKQFKMWWVPFFPKAFLIGKIKNHLIKIWKVDPKFDKKYLL